MGLKEGLNPKFDYNVKEIVIATDPNIDIAIEQALKEHIESYGFRVTGTATLDTESMVSFSNHPAFRRSFPEQFREDWNRITQPIDIETLIRYAESENLSLVKQLRRLGEGYTTDELKRILLGNSLRGMRRKGAIHFDVLQSDIEEIAAENKQTHVVALIDKHDIVTPLIVSQDGELGYHVSGRGGYLFGGRNYLGDGKGKVYAAIFTKTMKGIGVKINFAKEIFDHEFIGHAILGLDDHYGLPPGACVMATKRSRQEYVERARAYNGLYLCDRCRETAEFR